MNLYAMLTPLRNLLFRVGEEVLMIRSAGLTEARIKTDFTDIVTRADKRAEEMIGNWIEGHYLGHRIRGEEGTKKISISEYEWIIDPIDGTTNYANGMDLFGISTGLYKDGVGQLGMIYFPVLQKLAYAIKGEGAWINDEPIRMPTGEKTLQSSLITAGLPIGAEYAFPLLRARARNVLMAGCFTVEALWLAEGKVDACVHIGATPYDLAAARIIIEEAGGVSSGIKDDGLNLSDEKIPIILAKTPDLVRELRNVLKR